MDFYVENVPNLEINEKQLSEIWKAILSNDLTNLNKLLQLIRLHPEVAHLDVTFSYELERMNH